MSKCSSSYQKPYDYRFDAHIFPLGFNVPDFVKFSGNDNKSTREHISQFLA